MVGRFALASEPVQWGNHEIAFCQNAKNQYKWAVPGQMQVDMSLGGFCVLACHMECTDWLNVKGRADRLEVLLRRAGVQVQRISMREACCVVHRRHGQL